MHREVMNLLPAKVRVLLGVYEAARWQSVTQRLPLAGLVVTTSHDKLAEKVKLSRNQVRDNLRKLETLRYLDRGTYDYSGKCSVVLTDVGLEGAREVAKWTADMCLGTFLETAE